MHHLVLIIVGTLVLLVGLFYLYLVYAIGISGNSDDRPTAYVIIVVGLAMLAVGCHLWWKSGRNATNRDDG